MYRNREPTQVVTQTYSTEKLFVKILQNSHKNTCAEVSFVNKITDWGPAIQFARIHNLLMHNVPKWSDTL